ncbi:(2Fe-2S)-binding protein [Anaerobacillus alkaliphilus]|uniref:(2Fe-2S)-binding protein n=1 Tax=Anaerobacillus alkaliphilus TaxID=1548597 RepID=A0A4Q0VSH0_9BACI|nr:(2Fe-2S)-binding protein [Anaerobacillus alkaliphilus]RXJ00749.1 (2Fe-2S)-binding protein [Anaerobacillus alkaliphilus]
MLVSITLVINGAERSTVVRPAETLLYVVREKLGLTGSKPGCLNGDCGACTVLIDDLPMKSCLMLAIEAVGKNITTIEGLSNTDIQKAFVEHFAFQCGYCTPGFVMNCHSLIQHRPNATDDKVEDWLHSNLCRCTGYEEIKIAVKSVLNRSEG